MALIGKSAAEVQKAVQEAVRVAEQKGQDTIQRLNAAHSDEIRNLKNKTAKEMAELTSQKDTAEFRLGQATKKATFLEQAIVKNEELLTKIKEKLNSARKSKIIEQLLPTGNKLITSVNKNGAKMKLELTTEGKKVSCQVETLEGKVKKTIYDPTTGKPLATFSNVSGKPIQTRYENGHSLEAKEINVKKPKTDKPYPILNAKTIKNDWDYVEITIPYSDGSRVVKKASKNTGEVCSTMFYKPGENQPFKQIHREDDAVITYTRIGNSNSYDRNTVYNDGTTVDYLRRTNDLGLRQELEITKYPKNPNTAVKSRRKIFNTESGQTLLIQEERKLKNGDLITIKFNPYKQIKRVNTTTVYNYKVESLEIKSPNGEKITLNGEDALKYLRDNEPPHVPIDCCADKTMKHAYV